MMWEVSEGKEGPSKNVVHDHSCGVVWWSPKSSAFHLNQPKSKPKVVDPPFKKPNKQCKSGSTQISSPPNKPTGLD